jgi:hypothetical protein
MMGASSRGSGGGGRQVTVRLGISSAGAALLQDVRVNISAPPGCQVAEVGGQAAARRLSELLHALNAARGSKPLACTQWALSPPGWLPNCPGRQGTAPHADNGMDDTDGAVYQISQVVLLLAHCPCWELHFQMQ